MSNLRLGVDWSNAKVKPRPALAACGLLTGRDFNLLTITPRHLQKAIESEIVTLCADGNLMVKVLDILCCPWAKVCEQQVKLSVIETATKGDLSPAVFTVLHPANLDMAGNILGLLKRRMPGGGVCFQTLCHVSVPQLLVQAHDQQEGAFWLRGVLECTDLGSAVVAL